MDESRNGAVCEYREESLPKPLRDACGSQVEVLAPLLEIRVLGTFRMERRAGSRTPRVTRAVLGLLTYLALYRERTHSREGLIATFWPDYHAQQGQRCLSTALWRVRSVVEPRGVARGTFLFTTSTGELGFRDHDGLWLDAWHFEREMAQILRNPPEQWQPSQAARLESTLGGYGGELLSGMSDEWIVRERDRFELLHLRGLEQLLQYRKLRDEHSEVVRLAQSILRKDPLREDVHRAAMLAYSSMGQRALAAQQYLTCKTVLARELSVEPSDETRALHGRVALGVVPARLARTLSNTRAELSRELERTLAALETAQRQLRTALELIDELAPAIPSAQQSNKARHVRGQ
jgi:DNA-binding SARP family transcriptional activator